MQHALLTGTFCVCAVLASGPASADSVNPTGREATPNPVTSSSQTISVLNSFAFGYLLGGGVEAAARQVLENIISEMAANYVRDPNSVTACQVVAPPEPDTLVTKTTTYLQSVWPLSDQSRRLHQQLASFTLGDYLPDVRVTIHGVSTDDSISIRMVPSQDGSVIRVVRSPGG